VHLFPGTLSTGVVFDNAVLEDVRAVWRSLVGDEIDEVQFLCFEVGESQAQDKDEDYV
jgi:hypothetical protein